jgi:hypothetical protein
MKSGRCGWSFSIEVGEKERKCKLGEKKFVYIRRGCEHSQERRIPRLLAPIHDGDEGGGDDR